jgi:GT2 family glycosyltransferase
VDVGAVVLHYRHWPGIKATLELLIAELPDVGSVVVVDNASGDGSADRIRQAYPGIRVVEAEVNDGYAAGMSLGLIALGQCTQVLLLTHECRVGRGAVGLLASALRARPDVAIAGPLLGWASDPDAVWSAGGGFGRRTARTFHHQNPPLMSQWSSEEPREVDWVDGAAMLLRRDVLEIVGGLDRRYFLYDEEVDLALRVRALGYAVLLVPAARAWQEPLKARNRLLLLARNRGMRRFLVPAAAELSLDVIRAVRPGASKAPERHAARLRLAGAVHAMTGRLDRQRAVERPSASSSS